MAQVFKFGGASVKDAAGVRNVCSIIKNYGQNMVVVISAMGKTTNAMEELVEAFWKSDVLNVKRKFDVVCVYHWQIVNELFELDDPFIKMFDNLLNNLWRTLQQNCSANYDFEYDRIVSFGEVFSTQIISNYANNIGVTNKWVDIKNIIKTDENYRDANVNWGLSSQIVKNLKFHFSIGGIKYPFYGFDDTTR